MSRHLALIAAVLGTSVLALQAHGAVATEYFNGYGTANRSLVGISPATPLNGGTGWSGAWAGDTNPQFISRTADPTYFNLTYTATGYANTGNGTSLSDGASMFNGGNAANIATRSLRVGTTADTGLTGTIWISALVNEGSNASSHTLLWMDRPDGAAAFVSIRSQAAVLRYNGADTTGSAGVYAASTTYLFLAKVVMNVGGGTTDTLDFWINPNLSGGEAGLGTPTLSGANNANALGNAFSGIGISFQGTGKMDSIRISNEATAFNDVTLVPEPTSIGLLGLAAVGLLTPRRRNA